MLTYKIDVLKALRNKGLTQYRIRQDKLVGQSTVQALHAGKRVSWNMIDWLCGVLDCQPGDILQYKPDKPDKPAST